MIKIAAKVPQERMAMSAFSTDILSGPYLNSVNKWRGKLAYDQLPKVRAWGIEVQTQMMTVKARVLQPPNIVYGAGKTTRASYG